jgi:hexosaminidase
MVKRMVVAAAVALGLLAAPAAAQQYPPAQNSLTVSDTTPTPGQTVDITAQTCVPGSSVTVTLDSDQVVLGTAAADSSGVAGMSATIPANTSLGAHTIIARCTGSDGAPLTLTAAINVVAADGSGGGSSTGGGLPRTGDDTSLPLARIGLALAAAGGVITAVAAKRRKATTAV